MGIDKNLSGSLLGTLSAQSWKKVEVKERSGILAPLFSLRSRSSLGPADLNDLKLLIDWVRLSGNSILQLLPMNEVGPLFCPYDSISSFALEPMYINISQIPCAKNRNIQQLAQELKKDFPPAQYVDYRIKERKLKLLFEIFRLEQDLSHPEFEAFREENSYWLDDFCLYKTLKDFHRGQPWYEWEEQFRNRVSVALEDFRKSHEEKVIFYAWVQWQLFKQFKLARKYAKDKRILLKGDLPILVSRDSADVWAHPQYFKLNFAAGAPADMYCARGQRWGMPTYDWETIASDGYVYLKEKLKYAENFYDILRIDHVVGLFRIWSIPYNEPLQNQGLNGSFDPRNEVLWGEHGRNILSEIITSTNMLLCAEDLGVIPRVCIDTLKNLGIPGNDVQRWVKDWNMRHDFLPPHEYRQLSVAMLSTHDTTNWPAWWENEAGTVDEALFIRKCNERGILYGEVQYKLFDSEASHHGRNRWRGEIDSTEKLVSILGKRKEEVGDFIDLYLNTFKEKEKLWKIFGLNEPMREKSDAEIMRKAIEFNLNSSAIFCINTIFDWLYLSDILKGDPYQYRINTPGTISGQNWSLVIPLTIEELLHHKISKDIQRLVTASGRGS